MTNPVAAASDQQLTLALTESTPAGAAALLQLAENLARRLGQTDLSKTQLRAVYTAVRKLEGSGEQEVRPRLDLVLMRLAYLNEIAQRSYQLEGSRAALAELYQTARAARNLVLAEPLQQAERADRLVELFQAILGYQALQRERRITLRPQPSADEETSLLKIIQSGDGGTIFQVAQWAVETRPASERNNPRWTPLDLSKTQLRNVFSTLKIIQAQGYGQPTLWQLRLLEARLLYALSRDPGLENIVVVLYHALRLLYRDDSPTRAGFANFMRLAESILAIQVYLKAGQPGKSNNNNPPQAVKDEGKVNIPQAIAEDNGHDLNKLAKQLGTALSGDLGRSQLRNLYNTVRRLELNGFGTADLAELQRLRTTLRYVVAREARGALKPLFQPIDDALVVVFEDKNEATQRKRAFWLADLFEAIIAWQLVGKSARADASALLKKEEQDELSKVLTEDDKKSRTARLAESLSQRLRPAEGRASSFTGGKGGLSKGQIRVVFVMLKQEALAADSRDLGDLKRRLWLMIPRLEYAAAREPGLALLKEVAVTGLEKTILNDTDRPTLARRLNRLVDLLEGIVAFYVID